MFQIKHIFTKIIFTHLVIYTFPFVFFINKTWQEKIDTYKTSISTCIHMNVEEMEQYKHKVYHIVYLVVIMYVMYHSDCIAHHKN